MPTKSEYTIMLPVANNLLLAISCINHLLRVSTHNIIVVDDWGKDEDYPSNSRLSFIHLKPEGRLGLSKLWNICIKACPTPKLIMASWRPRPIPEHFEKIEKYLNEGYGMVALESLHFFAMDKRLFGVIGLFDEGFTQGQYEDTDFFNRLYMSDIGIYASNEIKEEPYPTMWPQGLVNKAYYETKWAEVEGSLLQYKEEVNIEDRKLYPNDPPLSFKPFSESILLDENIASYYKHHSIKEKLF